MTSLSAQTSIFLRIAALTAAIVAAAFLAATPATGREYTLDIPTGGNTVPPPLTTPTTPTAPPTGTGTVGTATGEVTTTGGNGKGKGNKKPKGKKKEEQRLPKLGPDKPGALAAPVSAVARGTTPGILPLAGVLVALLLAAFTGRRLIRNRAA